jgi:hypothetical protein
MLSHIEDNEMLGYNKCMHTIIGIYMCLQLCKHIHLSILIYMHICKHLYMYTDI